MTELGPGPGLLLMGVVTVVPVGTGAVYWLGDRHRPAGPGPPPQPLMAATKTGWRRRWLPPLLVVAGLVVLAGGITLALTAATGVQRFLGWLIATSGALNTVVAGWQLWWVWSGRGGPPPRH